MTAAPSQGQPALLPVLSARNRHRPAAQVREAVKGGRARRRGRAGAKEPEREGGAQVPPGLTFPPGSGELLHGEPRAGRQGGCRLAPPGSASRPLPAPPPRPNLRTRRRSPGGVRDVPDEQGGVGGASCSET